MKKAEVIEIIEKLKEKALCFLKTEHRSWDKNDPRGLAERNLTASEVLTGVELILAEIGFMEDTTEFEIVSKAQFQKYKSVANLLFREDIGQMGAKWRELYGNIENMEVLYDEPSYKMGELSIFEAPSVYIIYTEKI